MRRTTSRILTTTTACAAALTLPAALPALAGGATRVDAAGPVTRYALPNGAPNPVQAGATARVHAVYPPSGKTIVTLVVDGFPAGAAFGAHVHKSACGATDPLASGGHYQHIPGTVSEHEEVWLDFATDASGHGEVTAVVDWRFVMDAAHPEGANSVVVHRDRTAHDTGAAGPRLACLTVPFTG